MTSLLRPVPPTAAILAIAAVFFSAAAARAHKTVISPFTYHQDVRPIFERQCVRCHDPGAPSSPLRFENAVSASWRFQQSMLAHAVSHTRDLSTIEFDTLMTWSAGGAPEGTPPPGVAPLARSKPHAIHAGVHGGMLSPALDDSLHIEAAWAEQRRFRAYVTNPAGDPLDAARLGELQAHVIDGAGASSPLSPNASGEYLEARIASQPVPARFTVVVKRSDRADEVIGFTFSAHSSEPRELEVPATVVPDTPAAIAAAVAAHAATTRTMIDNGQYGQLYLPTTHVRNLLRALSSATGDARAAAVRRLMIADWQLHLDGDNNGAFEVRRAAAQFDAAVADLVALFR